MTRGTNSVTMKENNKKLILNLIRQGNYSRADLAKEIGLTKAALTILTDEMIQNGIIFEELANDYSGVGRRPRYLRLCGNSKYVIGMGITRSGYEIGLFDLYGNKIVADKYLYLTDDSEKGISDIARNIEKYKKMVSEKDILGVGVAAPGPLDYRTGTILNPPNFEAWHNCNLCEKLSSSCGLPVRLENMANAMALMEQYFGSCKSEKNFAYIVVDEGIGAGIIVDGKIYRGKRGYGNELGHISIKYDGILCSCGNRGCLECYASIISILKGTKYNSWQDVIKNNDEKLIMREAEYLSAGIVSLLNLFDLGTIVLGGNICDGENVMSEKINEIVNERAIIRHPVRIIPSDTGHERALAAASVALSSFFY